MGSESTSRKYTVVKSKSKLMIKGTLKTILEFAVYLLIVGAVVWGVPHYLSVKYNTEYPIAAITSGSMWPVLKTGDLVLIKNIPRDELKVGDIIVWKNPKGFTIHRIIKLEADTLTTRGDANFIDDTPVEYSKVVGRTIYRSEAKPFRIPYLGYVSVWSAALKSSYFKSASASN